MKEEDIKKLNIFQKMSLATSKIQTVTKKLKVGEGTKGEYKAVSETDVLNAVKPIEADKVEIEYPIDAESEESAPRVKKGETMQLTAIITPDNTTDKTIKWSVDNESIAEIDDDGILTALGTGMVIVTAESNNGKTAEIEIELYSNTAAGVAGVGSVVAIAAGVIYFLKRKKSKNNIE